MSLSRRRLLKAAAAGLAARLATPALAEEKMAKTNLVFILTDNQGAWTLGCYGNPDIRTPSIDALARDGTRFTRAFAVNAVCSPTRATFLTGLIPSQHGVHCYLGAGGAQMGPGAYCTIREFRTLPKLLAEAGYACGLVGKWHLGANLNPQEGFTYWITKPHGHTTSFYDVPIIHGGKVANEPRYTTDLWTDHACRFIEASKDRPFFLFLAYNGPYGLGSSLRRPARNRHAATYADSEMRSFPRLPMHPWLVNNKEYLNNVQAMRRYAAECSGVDDGVGEVVACLKRLGLDGRTLVVYSADQGWGGGQHGLWGMGDHSRPLHAFDDTMHIPLIFRQPGVVSAGRTSDAMVCTYDWMPTLLSLLGLGDKMPAKPPSPGRDFAPILRGQTIEWEQAIYYEFEDTRAVRTSDWKYIHRHPAGPHELYDLKGDPGELKNLVDDPAQAETRRDLKARLDAFFARYADPQYDLWRAGRSKAGRILRPRPPASKAAP
ncbi:MAG TPA: sulfatase-like hydrolase/transferase [Planctomycetota bacterium]|nr:sulfatase-like hydrolase/transferase [Planctomycetota bacterium]